MVLIWRSAGCDIYFVLYIFIVLKAMLIWWNNHKLKIKVLIFIGTPGALPNWPSANRPPKKVSPGHIGPLNIWPWTIWPPVENFCN